MRALPCVLALALAGCGTTRWPAPMDSRGGDRGVEAITGPTYRVRAGDTLGSIAQRASLDYRRIAEWNRLASPDRLVVGQVLRLTPPGEGSEPARARPAGEREPVASKSRPAQRLDQVAVTAGEGLRWQWPTSGRVVERFASGHSARKGIKISGRPGQPIQAAERGEVVYSGSGLVGYGPLIIIKHNTNYLSAYGHNRKLLVQQGDQVTKGMQIAEMGLAGGAPLLHFEIRRDGDPVDPLALLPRR